MLMKCLEFKKRYLDAPRDQNRAEFLDNFSFILDILAVDLTQYVVWCLIETSSSNQVVFRFQNGIALIFDPIASPRPTLVFVVCEPKSTKFPN